MKFGIYTLGCKVNTYESEFIISLLENHGFIQNDFNDINDIYIINTCTVTNNSDSKSRKIINKAIAKNKDACIIAMGCFIEANKDYNKDGIDIIIGNKDKSKIIELIEEYFKEKKQIIRLYDKLDNNFENMEIKDFGNRCRAFVKIQDGCENFCTYCIIPYVRGKCRSKNKDLVIKEITNLVENNYKEIVLTGIHTGNYGVDINYSFAKILKDILKIKGLKRLRISSIEITELTDEVLDIIKENDIIVDHLHIPLQSGSAKVLKLMNRKYDKKYFKDKINKIRSIRKDISITTDVIVGFPNETEEDFKECLDFCKEINFSKIHVFPYSIRKNTPAAKMPNQVDGNIKKKRVKKLLDLSKELELSYMNKFLNKEVEVLIEECIDNISYGHTSNYLYVKINKQYQQEDIVKVKIVDVLYPYCIGK